MNYHPYYKYDTKNCLIFNKCKIINKKGEVHNKATRTNRESAMLLLLHRLLTDAMMFSAFEKKQQLMTAARKRCWE